MPSRTPHRRRFLKISAVGLVGLTGCLAEEPKSEPSVSETPVSEHENECEYESGSDTSPQTPFDILSLYRVPDYVTGYSDSVIVDYGELDPSSQQAVRAALASDESYRECNIGKEQTDVMTLYEQIEQRWEEADIERSEHTYIKYQNEYYAVGIVGGGDLILVDSIPCTADKCPTTPTPPET